MNYYKDLCGICRADNKLKTNSYCNYCGSRCCVDTCMQGRFCNMCIKVHCIPCTDCKTYVSPESKKCEMCYKPFCNECCLIKRSLRECEYVRSSHFGFCRKRVCGECVQKAKKPCCKRTICFRCYPENVFKCSVCKQIYCDGCGMYSKCDLCKIECCQLCIKNVHSHSSTLGVS